MGNMIQSVVRATEILKCFSYKSELRITEITSMVNLHKSTVFGLVSTLHACGFLQQNSDSGKYSVGIELFRLGQLFNINLNQIILPYLNKIMGEFQETVNYVIPEDEYIIYLEKIESPHSMRISTSRAARLPLYCTGAGKAILAFMPEDILSGYMEKIVFKKYTNNTVSNAKQLKEQLETIRAKGYSIDDEEFEYGLVCVAVPIISNITRLPIGALSVSGPTVRMSSDIQKNIAEKLMEYSKDISFELRGLESSDYFYR